MCEAKVFLKSAEGESLLMEDVVSIRPGPEGLHLHDIMGKEITVQAQIEEIGLLKHKVILRSDNQG